MSEFIPNYGSIIAHSLTVERANTLESFQEYFRSFDLDAVVCENLQNSKYCLGALYFRSVTNRDITIGVDSGTDYDENGNRHHFNLTWIIADIINFMFDNNINRYVTKRQLLEALAADSNMHYNYICTHLTS